MFLFLAVVVAAQPSVEIFRDRGDFFVRAGTTQGLKVGDSLVVLGAEIASTGERRSAGNATVLEVWPQLARVSLNAAAQLVLASDVDGQPIGDAQIPVAQATAPLVEATSITRYGSAFIDPVGFLTFGPVVGFEFGTGHASGAVYGRWFDGGLITHTLIGTDEAFTFSFGIGGRFRYYLRDGLAGFHFGAIVEWLRTRVENYSWVASITSNYLVPQFEFGYRWGWSRLFLDLAGSGGISTRLFWKTENLPGGNRADLLIPPAVASFFGSVKLEFGVYF